MGDSGLIRSKRNYHHKTGDHSMCVPARCADARVLIEQGKSLDARLPYTKKDKGTGNPLMDELDPNDVAISPIEYGFGPDGARYWYKITTNYVMTEDVVPLLIQSCRLIDRLRRLDETIKGRGAWMHLRLQLPDEGTEHTYKLIINGMIREEREESTALRGLISELRNKLEKIEDKPEQTQEINLIDGLNDELDARRRKSAG